MYETKFTLTDGTELSSDAVNSINLKAIEGAVHILATKNTKEAKKVVASRK